jgi:hypothetical protein
VRHPHAGADAQLELLPDISVSFCRYRLPLFKFQSNLVWEFDKTSQHSFCFEVQHYR